MSGTTIIAQISMSLKRDCSLKIVDSLITFSLYSSWSGGEKSSEDADQTLNIFSVASGHLYERLLR